MGVKHVFSLISVVVIFVTLINGGAGYYGMLFIFLINRVVDGFFEQCESKYTLFAVWEVLNKFLGIVAVTLALGLLTSDFAALWGQYLRMIDYGLFAVVLSYVFEEILVQIAESLPKKS